MGKMTGLYACPACNNPVTYRSAGTRLIECPSCHTVLNRLESDDLILHKAAVIKETNDLIQPGAKGVIQGQKFEVLGRFRVWLDESVINYWTLLVEGNSVCMLTEGYGLYALLRRVTLTKAVKTGQLESLQLTQTFKCYKEDEWLLQRKDSCYKYEIEGEVYLPECNDGWKIFDLYAKGKRHLQIVEFLSDYLVAYEMIYTSYQSLELTGLSTRPPVTTDLKCGNCQTNIPLRTWPYAQSCTCRACGTRYAYKDGLKFRSQSKDKKDENEFRIPMGAVGTIKGISYEIIGYCQKEEIAPYAASWKEYVLYNRAEGYAFLTEYANNWIYAREQGDSPVLTLREPSTLNWEGQEYRLFNKYKMRILDSYGEFPYDAFDDNGIESAEFIAPPKMWAYEKSQKEGISWFLCEHVDRDELIEQFPYNIGEPYEWGVLDPRGSGSADLSRLIQITLGGIFLLVVVHFLIGMGKHEQTLLNTEVKLSDSAATTSFTSSKFDLTKWSNNLRFDLHAPVNNDWLDFEAALVNDRTGQEYSIGQVVEYYSGVDDGDHWSEGDQDETVWLNSIPSGKYFLRIDASRDSASTYTWTTDHLRDFSLKVTTDVPVHRNLWIFIALMLLYPIIQGIRIWYFERKRWEGSPYSPYKLKK